MPAYPKYRPSLTLQELQAVVDAVRTAHPSTRLTKYLEGFLWETENGLKKPAHVTQASAMEVKLGLDVHRFPEHFMAPKIQNVNIIGHWENDLMHGTNKSGRNPNFYCLNNETVDQAMALNSKLLAEDKKRGL